MKIGFVGQGWIGKNYANDFENRGYEVVRYSLENEYVTNQSKIAKCDIVFIAVPTPTTPGGFDFSAVKDALKNVGENKIAVIKSTIVPGTTKTLQNLFPNLYVFHSPEFLVEKTAANDAAHPNRNIVGIPVDTPENREKAEAVLNILPDAPYEKVMTSEAAELVKYAGNCFLFTKVLYMNLLYDVSQHVDANWNDVREALANDPRIGASHTDPVHQSGRGAGGHCFIKDFEAFRELYNQTADPAGSKILEAMVEKNIELLTASGKDLELLKDVYGDLDK